ncbi:CocE/NonD family hydrolase [Kushneria aurantia]|uniref:CocE/NonD family hydrolase n=1 Tax=Kushneria aurantia TaxID=504092 RepID=A0ABV6G305_9GAMM|nr:CocE/NonD family hydrolase [Kushneria aurantia]
MKHSTARQEVIEQRHVEIRLADGCRLAARIWRPRNTIPVPAIVEYLPYRKGDHTLPRDAVRAPWIAAHGYAYVRVDIRGSGESEGIMTDEYTHRELQDGCEVIAWLAEQVWCDGNVGMVGISWGGFNGLQIAALQPPALKAVVSIASTDDRYADDVHYMGGTMVIDQISWASHMFAINTLPPDPELVGDRWRDMWLDRLRGSGLWLKNWLEHQRRDDFWKHGSVCEDITQIKVPVYAVSGWADGYTRTVFRLMETLQGPRKGLVGPWAHKYPHIGVPGPAIDWLQEELRWWDQWLKGIDTGIMSEPPLRLYMQDHARPASYYAHRDGRWIEEPAWPSPNVDRVFYAPGADASLVEGVASHQAGRLALHSPLSTGIAGGKWCSYARPGDQPVDQRRDDAGSLVFQTAPLTSDLEILGDARLDLTFSVDQPVAQLAARLVDIAPDGAATRVSYGLLNLTHRHGHETPEALVPGETCRASLAFKHIAQRLRRGHRLRLSLSTSYFPVAWPSPQPVTLTLDTGATLLELPVRHAGDDRPSAYPDTPQGAPPLAVETLRSPHSDWVVHESLASGETRVVVTNDSGAQRIIDNGVISDATTVESYSFNATDWRSCRGHVVSELAFGREGWGITSHTETEVTASATHFRIRAHLRACESDEVAHEERWDLEIPRDLA